MVRCCSVAGEGSHERCKLDRPVQPGDGLNAHCVVPGLSAHLPPGAGTHIDAENAAPPGSDVPEAKAVKKASLINVALQC